MSDKRVFEYARELGLESQELKEKLEEHGIPVENHLSVVSEKDIKPLRPELYYHQGGNLTVDELAKRLGLVPEFIALSVQILNKNPQEEVSYLASDTIDILTAPQRPLRLDELAWKLEISPHNMSKLLEKIDRPVEHYRSKVDPITVNIIEKIQFEGIKEYLKNKKKNKSLLLKVGQYSLVILLIFFLSSIAYIAYGFYGLTKISQPNKINPKNNKYNFKSKKLKPNQPINVLVLGVEATDWENPARSDTIMVVRVIPKTNEVTIVSIPRDSRVEVEDYGKQKLTHAHFYGGSQLLIDTIYENFGIPIDRCVEVNFKGFYEIIDYLGGVDLYVEKPIYSPKFWDFDPFTIPEGDQHLNAKEALAYVHFRFDQKGDIGRIERQQKFIKVISNEIKKTNNIVDLPRMINRLAQHVRTDMTISEMLSWARLLWNINIDEVKTETLPGYPKMIYNKWAGKDLSYWIIDEDEADPLIKEVFGIYLNEEESEQLYNTYKIKPTSESTVYTVKRGDTLSLIAKEFSVDLEDLIEANPKIKDPRMILVGDVINIPLEKEENNNLE